MKRGKRKETPAELARRARRIFTLLSREYPGAHCELDFRTPYELLVATILSAQCTDARVNLVTPAFFRRFPTPQRLAGADPAEVEDLIRSTGFFRNKTKSLIGMAQGLTERHGGMVPREMEQLRELPGVGRKTANVVLGNAYGINEGVTVDTHVTRVAGTARPNPQHRPAPDRSRSDGPVSPEAVDPAVPSSDLARPAGLHRAAAPLRALRGEPALPLGDRAAGQPPRSFRSPVGGSPARRFSLISTLLQRTRPPIRTRRPIG